MVAEVAVRTKDGIFGRISLRFGGRGYEEAEDIICRQQGTSKLSYRVTTKCCIPNYCQQSPSCPGIKNSKAMQRTPSFLSYESSCSHSSGSHSIHYSRASCRSGTGLIADHKTPSYDGRPSSRTRSILGADASLQSIAGLLAKRTADAACRCHGR